MASKNSNPKGRENDIVVQELKGEVLLYDLNNNKAYCLNETSAIIWNLCDGNSSVSEITSQLSKQLKQPIADDLVYLALNQFKEDNLLLDNETVEIKFDGLSRREVIRKVGFASMIALPFIASLVAPTAALAQSAGPVVCAIESCKCADAFVLVTFPGDECSGLDLATPCPSVGCRCFVRDNDTGTVNDICAA